MALWDIFDPEFYNFLEDIIKKPIIIGFFLVTLWIIDKIRVVFYPDQNTIVEWLILFSDSWILILMLKYSIDLLIDLYSSIIKKINRITDK